MCGTFLLVGALAGCVSKAEYTSLLMRVDRLEAERAAQSKELQEIRTRNADLSADSERLNSDLRALRGQVDERRTPKGRLDDQLSDAFNEQVMAQLLEVRNRVIELETRLGVKPPDAGTLAPVGVTPMPPSPTATAPTPVAPAVPAPAATAPAAPVSPAALPPSQQFQTGYSALQAGRYKDARNAFLAYLAGRPDEDLADDAQFYVGETFYNERQFEWALPAYDKLIKNYPRSDKVPAALLKQGLCFASLNYTGDARVVLLKLVDSYPSTEEARMAREKLKELGGSASPRGSR
ncbi:MAG: tol-pal system protein YbgF [bacterium]